MKNNRLWPGLHESFFSGEGGKDPRVRFNLKE